MDKGFTEIFLNLFEFQSRFLKFRTAEEREAFVLQFLDCIAMQRYGENEFADICMTRMSEYREKSAERQRRYRDNKKKSEDEQEDSQSEPEQTDEQPKQDKPKSSRRRPKHDDSDNPEKKPYGEAQNVFLTDSEYSNLLKRNGSNLERIIEKISAYKASNGKVYASDYSAIINWVEGEVKQEMAKADSTKTFQQRDREDSAKRAREAFPEIMEQFGL